MFSLNYLVYRNLSRKGKLIALFVNLRAAFNTVYRVIMVKLLRKRGLKERLVKRRGDLYRETKFKVRAGEELGKKFWTRRGEGETEMPAEPGFI